MPSLVDAAELYLMLQGSGLTSAGGLVEPMQRWKGATEEDVAVVLGQMHRRLALLGGDRYPFELLPYGGLRCQEMTPLRLLYLSLLILDTRGWVRPDTSSSLKADGKEMEHLTEHALGDFFGRGTKTLNFGWPSSSGRPEEFPAALVWLAERVGIEPGATLPTERRRKDGGVDLVVWQNMSDCRGGVPIMLVQATIQQDFLGKERDVDRRSWAAWLSTDMDPLVALATPAGSIESNVWREASRNALLLDRHRLCLLASTPGPKLVSEMTSTVWAAIEEGRELISF